MDVLTTSATCMEDLQKVCYEMAWSTIEHGQY